MTTSLRNIVRASALAALLIGSFVAALAAAKSEAATTPECDAALLELEARLSASPHTVGEAIRLAQEIAGAPCELEAVSDDAPQGDLVDVRGTVACHGWGVGSIWGYARVLGIMIPLTHEPAAGEMTRFGSFSYVHAEGITLGLYATPFAGSVRVGPAYLGTPEAGAWTGCGWGFNPLSFGPVACYGAGAARLFGGSAVEITVYADLVNPLPCFGAGWIDVEVLEIPSAQ